MKKQLFKSHLLSLAALFGLMLALASCAHEDLTQKTTETDADNDKNLTVFTTAPETRTSMDYNTGAFYWEEGDHIYVQDDDNVWQKSSNAPTSKVAAFKFKVPGKFAAKTSYKVYYPGKNGNNNQVTIPATQTQTKPNTTIHFGESGDCGTADATKVTGKNQFEFKLDHQTAYLVFQPYTSNEILKHCYLTKIEVSADKEIAATYKLDPITGELKDGVSTGKQVVLTTKGSSTYANGFPLTTTSASVATNGAYMIIKPGTYKLKVRYWLKDIATGIEGSITKILGSFTYNKNTYYDMAANLDTRVYAGDDYSMWDAQKPYWYNWEWTKNIPEGQPTIPGGISANYPTSNTDLRYYNNGGGSGRYDATTPRFQILPNANEASWYAMYGDCRWDVDELWTTMGHLHKGGVWLKKKSALKAEGHYDTEKSADGATDLRIKYKYYQSTPSNVQPSADNATNYFFLPALGYYDIGQWRNVNVGCVVWTSSAYTDKSSSYYLSIYKSKIYVHAVARTNGYRAQALE